MPGAQGVHVLRAAWALGGAGIGPDVSRQPRAVGALRNVDDEGFMQGHEQGTEKEREMAWAVRAGAGVLAQEAKRTVFQQGRHPSQMRSADPRGFLFLVEVLFIGSKLPRSPGTACRMFLSLSAPDRSIPRCVCDGGGEAKSRALVSRLLETNLICIAKRATTLEKSLNMSVPPFLHL